MKPEAEAEYREFGSVRLDRLGRFAYVRRVIVNVVREESRRHWFKRERSSHRLPEREHPDHGEAESQRLTVLDALSRLPKRQRIAVVLRHWEDRSVEQTAEIMGCSAVTALTLTVLSPGGLFSGSHGNAAAGDELPDLDPKLRYEWFVVFNQVDDKPPNTSYTKAFWDHMHIEHPKAELDNKQYNLEGRRTVEPEHAPEFMLDQRELFEWNGGTSEAIYRHPVLSILVKHKDGKSEGSGPMKFQFGDGMPNFVEVEVIPDGRFRVGTEDVYDLGWCGQFFEDGGNFETDCEVDRVTGPDGERIENVLGEETRVKDDELSGVTHKTIVYRADGSAVIVSDTIRGEHGGLGPDESKDLGDAKPALSFEELTAIALALPEKPLE